MDFSLVIPGAITGVLTGGGIALLILMGRRVLGAVPRKAVWRVTKPATGIYQVEYRGRRPAFEAYWWTEVFEDGRNVQAGQKAVENSGIPDIPPGYKTSVVGVEPKHMVVVRWIDQARRAGHVQLTEGNGPFDIVPDPPH